MTHRFGTPTTNGTGQGTTLYIVDSGVLLSHQEFRSRLFNGSRATFGCDISLSVSDIAGDNLDHISSANSYKIIADLEEQQNGQLDA